MTNHKHTPGPWYKGYGGGYGEGNIYSDNFPKNCIGGREAFAVCHIPGLYQDRRHGGDDSGFSADAFEILEANAQLMATAPDLLRGLEAVVSAFKHSDPKEQNRRVHAIWRELADICAKARGEGPCYEDKKAVKALAKAEQLTRTSTDTR